MPGNISQKEIQIIAKKLGEVKPTVITQILAIARIIGIEKTKEFCEKALQTEAQGGLMRIHTSDKRTPGGIFFYLLRQEGGSEVKKFFRKQWGKPGAGNEITSC